MISSLSRLDELIKQYGAYQVWDCIGECYLKNFGKRRKRSPCPFALVV